MLIASFQNLERSRVPRVERGLDGVDTDIHATGGEILRKVSSQVTRCVMLCRNRTRSGNFSLEFLDEIGMRFFWQFGSVYQFTGKMERFSVDKFCRRSVQIKTPRCPYPQEHPR